MKEGKDGLGVRALARILHRSPSHICRVLKGERKPSAEIRRKLARRGVKFERVLTKKEGK